MPDEDSLTVSSAVQAVVDGYGPADLPALVDPASPRHPEEDDSPEASLLGGAIRDRPDAAVSASPARQVTGGTPPFLIMHGLDDNLVLPAQSEILYEALSSHGNDVILYLIDGFGHGFFNPGRVHELGPDQTLDQGHLEREPDSPATTRASSARCHAFVARYPTASLAAVEAFFARTLTTGSST